MNCKELHDALAAYLDDSLDEARRSLVRRHLRECPACRSRALAEDPTMMFAALGEPPVDPRRVEACAEAVTARIRQQRLQRRLSGPRRQWLAAAAAVVLSVGAAVTWWLLPGAGEPVSAEGAAEPEAERAPTVEVEMPSEDVRVYQFAAADDPDTAVVFIVNPALEL